MQQIREKIIFTTWKYFLLFIFLFFCFATPVYAIDITLQWTPNNEPNLAGYRAFYREKSQPYNYANPYWETIDPICTIYDLDETKTYYFVVRVFDTNGLESANSNEVLLIEGVPANNRPAAASGGGGGGGGGCFIATAAYGSLMAPHVKILSKLHDRFLLKNCLGKTFVDFYYKYSLPIADVVARQANLRVIVRTSPLFLVELIWNAQKTVQHAQFSVHFSALFLPSGLIT